MGDAPAPLPGPIQKNLSVDDDPTLWEYILHAIADEASVLSVQGGRSRLYMIVGSCSHWARPHQSRWTAAGGFAAPKGYGDGEGFLRGLPSLDWNVTLQFDPIRRGWVCPQPLPAKRFRSVRLAIPSRTKRLRQAAVHAVWSSGTLDAKHKQTVFYGFRKSERGWKTVAHTQRVEGETRAESVTARPKDCPK
jgi:hypothetical protein